MSEIIRCPKCLGRKTYRGIGLLDHKCDQCFGLGSITQVKPEQKVEDHVDDNVARGTNAQKIKSGNKPGRKSKQNIDLENKD